VAASALAVILASQRFTNAKERLPLLHAIRRIVEGDGSALDELKAAALPHAVAERNVYQK
jgi:hypothetical protein